MKTLIFRRVRVLSQAGFRGIPRHIYKHVGAVVKLPHQSKESKSWRNKWDHVDQSFLLSTVRLHRRASWSPSRVSRKPVLLQQDPYSKKCMLTSHLDQFVSVCSFCLYGDKPNYLCEARRLIPLWGHVQHLSRGLSKTIDMSSGFS